MLVLKNARILDVNHENDSDCYSVVVDGDTISEVTRQPVSADGAQGHRRRRADRDAGHGRLSCARPGLGRPSREQRPLAEYARGAACGSDSEWHAQSGLHDRSRRGWCGLRTLTGNGGRCRVGAEIVGMEGRLGILSAGALADLLVVGGDPLKDIHLLTGQGEHIVGGDEGR